MKAKTARLEVAQSVPASETNTGTTANIPLQGFSVDRRAAQPNQRCVVCDIPACRGVAPGAPCPEEKAKP